VPNLALGPEPADSFADHYQIPLNSETNMLAFAGSRYRGSSSMRGGSASGARSGSRNASRMPSTSGSRVGGSRVGGQAYSAASGQGGLSVGGFAKTLPNTSKLLNSMASSKGLNLSPSANRNATSGPAQRFNSVTHYQTTNRGSFSGGINPWNLGNARGTAQIRTGAAAFGSTYRR